MEGLNSNRRGFPKLLFIKNCGQPTSPMSRRNTCQSPSLQIDKGRLLMSRDRIIEMSRNEQRPIKKTSSRRFISPIYKHAKPNLLQEIEKDNELFIKQINIHGPTQINNIMKSSLNMK